MLGELAKLGFANMLDYVRPNPNDTLSIDFSALDRDQAAAIQEVVIDAIEVDGGAKAFRVPFKFADKRAALVDLAPMAGFHVGDATTVVNLVRGGETHQSAAA